MSRDQLLDFLTQRWVIVVNFFNELYGRAAQILPNFNNILAAHDAQNLNQSMNFTIQYVTSVRVFLTNLINAKVAETYQTLMSFILARYADSLEQINQVRLMTVQFHEQAMGMITATRNEFIGRLEYETGRLEYLIRSLTEPFIGDLKRLSDEFHSLVATAGLLEKENIAFLKLFVNKPHIYIQQIVYESIFEAILYILAKGLTREDRNVDPQPEFSHIKPTEE